MNYPRESELVDFFGVDPTRDGEVLCFTVSSEHGLSLTVSMNEADDSLQTTLLHSGKTIAVVCQEGLSQLRIVDGAMRGEFLRDGLRIVMSLKFQPHMRLEWSGLRTI